MMNIKTAIFWDVMLCNVADVYHHFGGARYPEDGGIVSQKHW
jgi:hypothetical protein